jgi:hypothetical protein
MTTYTPAPQQRQVAIPTEQRAVSTTVDNDRLLARVVYLEEFIRQKGLSPDEEAENYISPVTTANDSNTADTIGGESSNNFPPGAASRGTQKPYSESRGDYPGINSGDSRIQGFAREVTAVLSQYHRGAGSLEVTRLASLLQQSLRLIAEISDQSKKEHRLYLEEHEQHMKAQQEIRWVDKLLAVPASIMSPSQKVTLRAAAKAIQRAAPHDQKLVQVESWKLCKTVGQSKDTFLDNLTYLSEKVGVLRKETQRVVTEDGAYTTNLYIGATDLITRPEHYHVEKPRNHGGERLLCPHCHSDRLQKKVIITCMGCGAVLDEHSSQVNKEASDDPGIPGTVILQKRQVADSAQANFFASEQSNLTTDITIDQGRQVDDAGEEGTPDGELIEQEPASPPVAGAGDLAALMQEAAALLVAIAGTEPVHIEMSSRGPMKYYEVKQPFSLQDARDHLTGKKTKGAMLRRPDGLTRALCYDADTNDDWYTLQIAAHLLSSAGYVPLMEDSPAGRGGHLWVIYTDLVDARCAHRHVCELAPVLQKIRERWPGPGNHKVRLPGGRYVKPGFSQQCKIYDAIGGLVAENRREAARALLTMQTPAAIVPAYPPDPAPDSDQRCAARQLAKSEASRSEQRDQVAMSAHGPDAR